MTPNTPPSIARCPPIPPGYKQTEVGVIPEDWEVLPFGKLAHIERGKFTARPRNDPRYYGGDIPFIQTGDVTNANGHITTYSQTLNAEGLKVSKRFPRGTLFFTIAANIGDVGFATFDAACPDSLVAITPTQHTDKNWLSYELAKRKSSFESIATHNAQLNINLEKLRPYLLPHPPLPEQRAIAAALSDVDGLLGGLDRLIAKKRDLKQAAMQQLLTGQTRLPGFHGEWEVKRLGEVLKVRHGKSQHGIAAPDGKYPILASGGEIGRTNAFIYDQPSVLIGRKGTIDAPQYVDTPFWTVDTLFFTEISGEADAKFVFYKFTMIRWRSYNEASGVPSLNAKTIENIKVTMPPLPEQTAIATVLSEMDGEMAVLEQRREKTRALKQAMMQELLTGRTRLV
jgi:type I restriction enzyme S subunit